MGTKNVLVSFFLLLSLAVVANKPAVKPESLAEKIIETGKEYLGKPYRYRANSGFSFDCSGFVSHVLLQHRIQVPRSSRDMARSLRKVPFDEIQKGDLLFFKGRNASSSSIGHVAMVVDNTPGALKMIHATSRGIVIDSYPSPFYKRRYVSAGRVEELHQSAGSVPVDTFTVSDSLMARIERFDKGMGAVSVFKNGEEIYSNFFGFASIEKKVKNDGSTLFGIGSISKTLTATLIFKLIEEGKLNLDDTLSKWFPLFGNARKITVRHLLTHQSGLYNFTNDAGFDEWRTHEHSRKELIDRLLKFPNVFVPGSKAEYSNTNFVLLSWIAEDVSGESYRALLKRIITGPLKLKNTFSVTDSTMNLATSYTRLTGWERVVPTHYSIPLGAGALVSTPADLNRFMSALAAGKIISKESLATMKTFSNAFGMGVFKAPFYERESWGHTGGIDGFQSRLFYFDSDSVSVAITSNAVAYPQNDIMIGILSDLFDKKDYKLPEFKNALSIDPQQLKKYTGIYSSQGLPIKLTVMIQDDRLYAQGTGQPAFPLEYTGGHLFAFDAAGIKLEFMPESNQMVLIQMGQRFVMKKEGNE